ncbi:MAG: NADH:ubiquinone reductase (Na(+)-transporting) subunit C [Candidatus Marinimicrobia bacterium]|jgi:Na+-transporting NADH:ubiquinone oxidoreductase subunit C|nr:NADH:ubiquinone reductase (Na(+)-transporting) subunit C [Candidatus Neomarinimicrobiota bacterium]
MQSNSYTLFFTAIVTIVLGFLLSLAATSLKERQDLNERIDIRKNILRALEFEEDPEQPWSVNEVQEMFTNSIRGIVINPDGSSADGMYPEDITDKNKDRYFPVFLKIADGSIEGYAVPISGKGLWSTLFGYLAIHPDGNTVKGITFYKHGETPGLGGEVDKKWFTDNFKGKSLFSPDGKLVSVAVMRGLVDETSENANHQVDGISGATMTGKGITNFLLSDLKIYEPFLRRVASGETL